MKTFVAATLLALAAGCGEGEPSTSPAAGDAPRAWTTQLAEVSRGERTSVDLDGSGLRAVDLWTLADGGGTLERVTIVNFPADAERTSVDAAWAAALSKHGELRRIAFDGPVSAAVFAEPGGPPLTHLNLAAAAADGDDLRALAERRPSLELLRLHAPSMTDGDAAVLAEFPELRFLHLLDAPLTDAAAPHLAACATLESVYLDRAKLTNAGWEELHRLRPDLHLHADLTHPVGGH